MTIELKMSPFYDVITLEELYFLLTPPPPIIGVLVNAAVVPRVICATFRFSRNGDDRASLEIPGKHGSRGVTAMQQPHPAFLLWEQ